MNILSSGSIAMDVVLNSSARPEDDGFALIEKEKMQPGGSSSNVAVSAAGFGMGACQVGKVGNDEMGKREACLARPDEAAREGSVDFL